MPHNMRGWSSNLEGDVLFALAFLFAYYVSVCVCRRVWFSALLCFVFPDALIYSRPPPIYIYIIKPQKRSRQWRPSHAPTRSPRTSTAAFVTRTSCSSRSSCLNLTEAPTSSAGEVLSSTKPSATAPATATSRLTPFLSLPPRPARFGVVTDEGKGVWGTLLEGASRNGPRSTWKSSCTLCTLRLGRCWRCCRRLCVCV